MSPCQIFLERDVRNVDDIFTFYAASKLLQALQCHFERRSIAAIVKFTKCHLRTNNQVRFIIVPTCH